MASSKWLYKALVSNAGIQIFVVDSSSIDVPLTPVGKIQGMNICSKVEGHQGFKIAEEGTDNPKEKVANSCQEYIGTDDRFQMLVFVTGRYVHNTALYQIFSRQTCVKTSKKRQ